MILNSLYWSFLSTCPSLNSIEFSKEKLYFILL